MGNDKSILEKFTDTVKDIAHIAADAASHALSPEEPALKPGEHAVAYMPMAADGFVSDPMIVAPIRASRKKKPVAARPAARKPRKNKTARAVARKSAKKNARKNATKAGKKSVRKAAKKTAARKPGKAAKKKAAKSAGRKRRKANR